MNAPYSFNFKYNPILENPFRSEIDYNKEIDERVRQLQYDMIDNLIISPVKEERGIKIGAGTVEIKIPFINKAIALDKDDINEFKEMLSKIQQ